MSPCRFFGTGTGCSVRQAERSLAGLYIVRTDDLLTREGALKGSDVVATTPSSDLGDVSERKIAFE